MWNVSLFHRSPKTWPRCSLIGWTHFFSWKTLTHSSNIQKKKRSELEASCKCCPTSIPRDPNESIGQLLSFTFPFKFERVNPFRLLQTYLYIWRPDLSFCLQHDLQFVQLISLPLFWRVTKCQSRQPSPSFPTLHWNGGNSLGANELCRIRLHHFLSLMTCLSGCLGISVCGVSDEGRRPLLCRWYCLRVSQSEENHKRVVCKVEGLHSSGLEVSKINNLFKFHMSSLQNHRTYCSLPSPSSDILPSYCSFSSNFIISFLSLYIVSSLWLSLLGLPSQLSILTLALTAKCWSKWWGLLKYGKNLGQLLHMHNWFWNAQSWWRWKRKCR